MSGQEVGFKLKLDTPDLVCFERPATEYHPNAIDKQDIYIGSFRVAILVKLTDGTWQLNSLHTVKTGQFMQFSNIKDALLYIANRTRK